MTTKPLKPLFQHRHLLSLEDFSGAEILSLLDLAQDYIAEKGEQDKKPRLLRGRTQINLFFENSTRTRASFELAGKRLGADVMNMQTSALSIKKGETLIDTAMTLNAMQPDILVIRHSESGAVGLLAEKVHCAVVNAGDGSHEHPTQALLDALTIRNRLGRIKGMTIAICGDILHSRVARSNIILLKKLGAHLRLIAPSTLLPSSAAGFGAEIFHTLQEGLPGADIVMVLRLQQERMRMNYVPSGREYYHRMGLTAETLAYAQKRAFVMHPGPINRGVEIDGTIADDITTSLIQYQVEMGVAVRMAVLDALSRNGREA